MKEEEEKEMNTSGEVGKEPSGQAVESLVSHQQGVQPTERPWIVDGPYIVSNREVYDVLKQAASKFDGGYVCNTNKANAELIVRAVNAHDALIEIGMKILIKLDSPALSVTANDADELRAALMSAIKPADSEQKG